MAQAEAVRVVRTLAAAEGRVPTPSQEAHAQRFTEKLFDDHDLSLPISIESMEHEVLNGLAGSITTYHVLPQTWLTYLVEEDITLLTGPGADPARNLVSFWQVFKLSNPGHEVFDHHCGEALSKVIPVYLHGDEGRSIKKSPYLVVSMESPMAPNLAPRAVPCDCKAYMESRPDLPTFGDCRDYLLTSEIKRACLKMRTNYKGHSYLSRHLLFGVSCLLTKQNPNIMSRLLEAMVDGFTRLLTDGILIRGGARYYAAVVGHKGDMDWHCKAYKLSRSYSKIQDRTLGLICHACLASSGARSQHSFTDFSDDPTWETTLYTRRPWDAPIPVLATLPHDVSQPERVIVPDTLHVVKLGLARDLIGGILVVLLRNGFFDFDGCSRNFVDRLGRAHSHFVLYCAAHKEHPSLRGFTKQRLHMSSFMSAPWCNSKGSDSMILLRWLLFFVQLNVKHPLQPGFESLLKHMAQACSAVLGMFQLMTSHGLFLDRPCGAKLYVLIMRTLRAYRRLGRTALAMRMRAFILKPKAHALHHIGHSLKVCLAAGHPVVMSPQAHACEPNEDFIGRVSRLSRRVGVRCMSQRVFGRYFLKKKALMTKRLERGKR